MEELREWRSIHGLSWMHHRMTYHYLMNAYKTWTNLKSPSLRLNYESGRLSYGTLPVSDALHIQKLHLYISSSGLLAKDAICLIPAAVTLYRSGGGGVSDRVYPHLRCKMHVNPYFCLF
jgi:hypothetical protein